MHSITAAGIWNIQISIAARELVREADGVYKEGRREEREENEKTSEGGGRTMKKREDHCCYWTTEKMKKKERKENTHVCVCIYVYKLAARWEALLADDQSIAAST
jgi:hypothetical protein